MHNDSQLRKNNIRIFATYNGEEFVMPSLKQGVSFADSPDTIRDKGLVKGRIWKLPKGTILPDGLIFNVRDFDHPLLNVNRKMKKADFIEALDKLSSKMVRTNDVVK